MTGTLPAPLTSLLEKVKEWIRRLAVWVLDEIEVRAGTVVARSRLKAYDTGLPLETAVARSLDSLRHAE